MARGRSAQGGGGLRQKKKGKSTQLRRLKEKKRDRKVRGKGKNARKRTAKRGGKKKKQLTVNGGWEGRGSFSCHLHK